MHEPSIDPVQERRAEGLTLAFLLVIESLLTVFGLSMLFSWAVLVLDGTITQSATTCADAANRYHCRSTYQVLSSIDGTRSEVIAGDGDGSIQRCLPIGTTVQKRRWQLTYTVNGVSVDDFPRFFSAILSCMGLGVLTTGIAAVVY